MPFEVPPGVRTLHLSYDYSDRIPSDPQLRGGNTLDIGLFDPRGTRPSGPGFRGWSGSHKLEFSISETWATPPYVAGPIQAGTWHVLLGPYKVGPRGCDYTVTIAFSGEPTEGDARPTRVSATPPTMPAAAEPGWLRGDLHCHTRYSDGDSWPADMLSEAVSRGLDFLGVTDHNQVAHQAEYARVVGDNLPVVLPGVEVTTYGGHWNAWGTNVCWDFLQPTETFVSEQMRAAAASGALVSVNHPKPYGPPWEYPGAVGYHAIEVWNGDWRRNNDVSLAWWEQQLRAGRRVVAVGGSDTHRLATPDPEDRHGRSLGTPTTWARVGEDRSVPGVLSALRAGNVFVSRDVDGPQLYLPRDDGGFRVRAVDARGATLVVVSARGVEATARVSRDDWRETFSLENAPLYVRAQLVAENEEMLALTSAIFTQ